MGAQVDLIDLIAKHYLCAGKEIRVHSDVDNIVRTIQFGFRQKLAIAFAIQAGVAQRITFLIGIPCAGVTTIKYAIHSETMFFDGFARSPKSGRPLLLGRTEANRLQSFWSSR